MSVGTRLLSIGSVLSATIGGSLLHPVVSGQVTHTTHQGAPIGSGLLPAATAFVALALLLGLVAYRDHIPTVDRVVSSRTTKRVATVAVVGLVVTTAALSGVGGQNAPVGTAEAEVIQVNPQCSGTDLALTGISFGVADAFRDDADRCLQRYTADPVENISATDAYAGAVAQNYQILNYINTVDNMNQDVESVMWSKAKIAVYNELKNGSTEQAAMDAANATVDEYSSTQIENIITDANTRVQYAAYLADATGGGLQTPSNHVHLDKNELNHGFYNETGKGVIALPDGSNATVYFARGTSAGTSNEFGHGIGYYDDEDNNVVNMVITDQPDSWQDADNVAPSSIYVSSPDKSNTTNVARHGLHMQSIEALAASGGQVKDNVATYVPQAYAEYNSGNLTLEDLAASDPTTIATQAGTDYNTTGYYGLSNTQLAALGVDGDTNASHVVETTYSERLVEDNGSVWNNQTVNITGTLFYTGGDNQTFDTGTEYDPDNLNGIVYMTVSSMTDSSGNATGYDEQFYAVEHNFTVHEATNVRTGESLNSTTMEVRDYTSTNASLLEEELQRLKDVRAEYERELAAAGGAAGSSDTVLIAAIALAAGAALMYRRDDD